MPRPPVKVIVLGSGEGTNFEALAAAAGIDYTIASVGSDQPEARILDRARRRGIPTFTCTRRDHPDRAAHDRALARLLASRHPDWIALAGYMRLLGPAVLAAWPGRIVNIHPALLPAFPGLNTHARALAAGVPEHGSTVHFVTAELDAGPPILQGRLKIRPTDTIQSLTHRVKALEHRIYPLALAWLARDRVKMVQGQCWLDGRPLNTPPSIEEQEPGCC